MKKTESIRLFESDFLESFTHIHPATPSVVYIPVVLYFLYRDFAEIGASGTGLFFMTGLVVWTLLEYALHRGIFHLKGESELAQRLHFLFHGIHHDYPSDASRLVMPLGVSIPLAVIFYFIFSWVFGHNMAPAFAGLVTGYLAYDNIHFAVHHFPMKNRFARYLKAYHLKHHFVDSTKAYGVSNPFWDYVFGTKPK